MKPIAWLVGGMLVAAVAFAPSSVNAQASKGSWTASDCEACHDKAVTPAFAKTAHAKQDQSCATCHGSVEAHFKAMSDGKDGPKPTLKGLKASEISGRCLTCHEKGNQDSYGTSMHSRRDVSCVSCHSVHNPKSAAAQLKTKNDSEMCFSCHKTERAKSLRTSHHPVREGKMGCVSCHNPHDGNKPKMIKAESINDLCFTCHTEKRGPYLFEHAPVREDCISCHDIHGSNHQRMLVQKLPTLCWNCHLNGGGHFSQTSDFRSTELGGTAVAAGAPNPAVNTNVARGSRWTGRSCLNCHLNIHGSNSPSGAYFVR